MTLEFLQDSPNSSLNPPQTQTQSLESDQVVQKEPFQPTGALVFFCGMLVMFAALWFALYGIVLKQN
jgi:hypothetical protein